MKTDLNTTNAIFLNVSYTECFLKVASWLGRALSAMSITDRFLSKEDSEQVLQKKIAEVFTRTEMVIQQGFPARSIGDTPGTGIYLIKRREENYVTSVMPRDTCSVKKVDLDALKNIRTVVADTLSRDEIIRSYIETIDDKNKEIIISNVTGSLIRDVRCKYSEESDSDLVGLAKKEINTVNKEQYYAQALRLIKFSNEIPGY